jgi:cytochrome c biogenesis protein CcmG/thiol:disulfide interchange protein DsbE
MARNSLILIAVILLVGFAVYNNANSISVTNEEAPRLNFMTPSFKLEGLDDGETYTLNSANLQKPVLINFWASWCGPCHTEAPDLKKLHEKYGDRVDFYALNATEVDSVEGAREFVETYGFAFPVPMDLEGEVADLYEIQAFPTTYFIDAQGAIRDITLGSMTLEQMESKIKRILP